MATIFRYSPVLTPGPSGTDYIPNGENITPLCELGEYRYVSVPEGVEVDVPPELSTWEEVTITPELRETIKAASHLCAFYRDLFIQSIRRKHSLDDELYYARIASGTLLGSYTFQSGEAELLGTYQADVEAAREVLHQRYSDLGL